MNDYSSRRRLEHRRLLVLTLLLTLLLGLADTHSGVAGTPSPTITATKVDFLQNDVDGDTQYDPGDTIRYTISISNTSVDATNVNFTDTIDLHTTLVGGSLQASPVPVDDTYNALCNVGLDVPVASGVLVNDYLGLPAGTLSLDAASVTPGASVTLNADGSFTYLPPVGMTGADSFDYQISGLGAVSDRTGTVTINLSDCIFFVDNTFGGTSTGRIDAPYASIGALNTAQGTANGPAAGEFLFAYTGGGNYTGGLTLLNNQVLVGQGSDLTTVLGDNGVTVPPNTPALPTAGSDPVLTNGGTVLTVAQNNDIHGLTIGDSTADISGTNFGTLLVRNVVLNSTGQPLNLNTGTLDTQFDSIQDTGSVGGLFLSTVAGSLTTPTTTISGVTGVGSSSILIGSSSLNASFGTTSITNTGAANHYGVQIAGSTPTVSFGDLDISVTNGRAISATSGTFNATSGALSANQTTAGESVILFQNIALNVIFDSVSGSGSNAAQSGISMSNTTGTFAVNGTGTTDASGGTLQNYTQRAVLLTSAAGVSLNNLSIVNIATTGDVGSCVDPGFSGCYAGVYANGGSAPTLINVDINNSDQMGVVFEGTTGGTLQNSLIQTVGDEIDEAGFLGLNLGGVVTITGNTFQNYAANATLVQQTTAANLNLNVSNNTMTQTGAEPATLERAAQFRLQAGTHTVTFQANVITNTDGGLEIIGPSSGSTTSTITANNNTITETDGEGTGAFNVNAGTGSATLNFYASGNNITNPGQDGFGVGADGSAFVNTRILTNFVSSAVGFGVVIGAGGSSQVRALISGNTLGMDASATGDGIHILPIAASTARIDATVTNNTITYGGGASNFLDGIFARATGGTTVCLDVSGNDSARDTTDVGSNELTVQTLAGGTMILPGYPLGTPTYPAGDATMLAYFNTRNPLISGTTPEIITQSLGTSQNGACNAAVLAPSPFMMVEAPAAPAEVVAAVDTAPEQMVAAVETVSQETADHHAKPANRAPSRAPLRSGETVTVGPIATLPGVSTLLIQFDVTIDSPLPPGTTQVSNQGTITGTNFTAVLTDDPDVGGTTDPTVSLIPDIIPPDVTVNQAVTQADPTSASPILFTVVFSEPIDSTTFATADLSVGSTAGTLTPTITEVAPLDDTTFEVSLTGMNQNGTVTVSIPAGGISDFGGNTNNASTSTDNTVTFQDLTAPDVTVNQAAGQADPTNVLPINFTVVFSEPITLASFASGDVTLGGTAGLGGAAVTLTEIAPNDGTTFNVAVDGITSGTLTASLGAGVVTDSSGNGNNASTSIDNTVNFDLTPPTVQSATRVDPDPTNATVINWSVIFSEPVTGFDTLDLSIATGGALGGSLTFGTITGGPTSYNVPLNLIGLTGDGTIQLSVLNNGTIQDLVGNLLSGGTFIGETYTIDVTAPSVMLSSAAPAIVNAPFNMTIDFSEAINLASFTLGDITVTNGGTASNLVQNTATQFTVQINPTTPGVIDVGIGAGVLTDPAGNGNTVSNLISRTFDPTGPTVTINQAAVQADPTNVLPINFTVVFSEPINLVTFAPADISLTGTAGLGGAAVTLTEIAPNNGTTFNVAVGGITDGTVSASLGAGVVTDLAGNASAASASVDNTVTHDATAPTVQLATRVDPDPTNATVINWTVTFSEPVTGFDTLDLSLATGGALGGSLSFGTITGGPTSYNVPLNLIGLTGDGTIQLSVLNNGTIQDLSGNLLSGGTFVGETYTIDVIAPSVVLSSAAPAIVNAPFTVTIDFSEAINLASFTLADITVTNGGTASNLVQNTATQFTAQINPGVQGAFDVSIGAGVLTDPVGNPNTASNTLSFTFDTAQPSAMITTTSVSPTSVSPIPVTITFSESVLNFDAADITTTNANVTDFAGGGAVYTADLVPLADGLVTATINAGVANDAAGNLNTAAPAPVSVIFDSTGASATIDLAAGQLDPTSVSPINFLVTFSEAVTGFDSADIVLSGSAGATTAVVTEIAPNDGTTYNVEVSGMTGNGDATITFAAGAGLDSLLNPSQAPTIIDNTVTYDTTNPFVVSINRADPSPTLAISVDYTVTFSIPVIGVDASDFTLALTDTVAVSDPLTVGGGPTVYTVTVSGISGLGGLTLSLVDDDSITSLALVPLGGAGAGNGDFTGQTYTIGEIVEIPPPPPTPLCEAHNFDPGGVVRSSVSDAEGYAINCRILYQNGSPTQWLGGDLYNAGSIGIEGVLDLGVIQAIDIFSPPGLTRFNGGAVFCLRGQGTLIWMAASNSPRRAEIIDSYTADDFPGFTCVTLFEPGTLVLVSQDPRQ